MNKNRLGDLAELRAAAWAMERGYEVFRNLGCSGPADLILMGPRGEVIKVDVKKAHPCTTAHRAKRLSDDQVSMGVRRLWICDDGRAGIDDGLQSFCAGLIEW